MYMWEGGYKYNRRHKAPTDGVGSDVSLSDVGTISLHLERSDRATNTAYTNSTHSSSAPSADPA